MKESLVTVAYIVAGVMFIMSLGGLSHPTTSRRGNWYGIIGMIIALAATAAGGMVGAYWLLIAAIVPAVIIGAVVAHRVQMTSMPQLVAMLHSFVGLAAVLVGIATDMHPAEHVGGAAISHAEQLIHMIEIYLGVCIGSITFTGSIIAFGKLQGKISGNPMILPGRHFMNLLILIGTIAVGWWYMHVAGGEHIEGGYPGLIPLIIATVLTGLFGMHMVMAIGGADMPVVVSMLNSYSGWAAAAAGFMLGNDLLIITGALVGSSGAILSIIMCKGMNRSFISVIMGGFGTANASPSSAAAIDGEVTKIDVDSTVELFADAKSVVIVPGYGMAVAQAQHSLSEVTKILLERGINVRFAIHPVAGRLPGHMNILLAEANVSYEIVLEMDEVNDDLPDTDVVLVIGANDIVNPSAQDDPGSPIAGMPVLEVWKSGTVVVMKRSMASGYAGVDNPLFYKDNTRMLFGDAKDNVDAILTALRQSRRTAGAEG